MFSFITISLLSFVLMIPWIGIIFFPVIALFSGGIYGMMNLPSLNPKDSAIQLEGGNVPSRFYLLSPIGIQADFY